MRIQNALISVFHKDGLGPIVDALHKMGTTIYSTGGTQAFIEERGIDVERVEDLTSYPSILGGRVKTLHPKVFGGILARRENDSDQSQMSEFEIPYFDLVIVDLYPFEATVASGAPEQDIIEKIDIGGISLIRAAAKNFKDCWIISNMNQYSDALEVLGSEEGANLEVRRRYALEAFDESSNYDTAIYRYFAGDQFIETLKPQKAEPPLRREPSPRGCIFRKSRRRTRANPWKSVELQQPSGHRRHREFDP